MRAEFAIARVTFSEIMRDRVLYNIVLIAVVLFGVSILASKLVFIAPERVILDFGLSALGLSCAMIAVFAGASMLGREYDRRTIHMALSRPISRLQFVLGKFSGLTGVLFLNWLLLSGFLLGLYIFNGGNPGGTVIIALILLFFQSLMLGGLALFASSFSTTSIAVVFSIGFYLMGNNISQIRLIAAQSQSQVAKTALAWTANLLPNLEFFNLGTKVTYGLPVPAVFVFSSILYGLVVVAVCLLGAGYFLRSRESA